LWLTGADTVEILCVIIMYHYTPGYSLELYITVTWWSGPGGIQAYLQD